MGFKRVLQEVSGMDTLAKLAILGEAAKYDVCASSATSGSGAGGAGRVKIGNLSPAGCCHSFLPDGRCISLFKVLLTNDCVNDCFYCPNRSSRDVPRTSFKPEELAGLFLEFYKRNYVEGLFLSSGVAKNTAATMEDLLKTAEILRARYRFGGYIHLKILPGAGEDYIQRAAELADRLSINLEAPSAGRLKNLSRRKNFENDLLERMRLVSKVQAGRREGKVRLSAGQTTQFIVGAAGENDAEILGAVNRLYREVNLKRAYFSAFQPIAGTPLENRPVVPILREHRLYQSEFLMRTYGFAYDEIPFGRDGNLPMEIDPKAAAALRRPEAFPVEVNKASLGQLLRVPGIGPLSARRILSLRRTYRIRELEELKNLGVVTRRAAPFLLLDGRSKKQETAPKQLGLFDLSVLDGEVPVDGGLPR